MTKTLLLIILSIGYCLALRAQPIAAFTADRVTGCSPLVVHFSNQTTGASAAATYHWDLGNGNLVVAENPQAIYTTPGSYTVTLTVMDGGQSATTTGTVTVDQPPTVSFITNTTKGCASLLPRISGISGMGLRRLMRMTRGSAIHTRLREFMASA